MASEGPNNPGTMADDAAVGTVTWTNPDNAKTSNDSYATAPNIFNGTKTHYLKATNFGFSIPAGATINGIVVEIERFESSTGREMYDDEVKIVKSDGSIGAEDKSDVTLWDWSDPDSYVSYGGVADLWSEAWSATDINDADFGVVLSAIGGDGITSGAANVDHIRITVYYTASGVPNSPRTMADDAAVGNTAWNNVNNAKTSDDSYADCFMFGGGTWTSHYLKATNFGFNIPASATINGVIVEIERYATSNQIIDESIKLVVGGAVVGDEKSVGAAWQTVDNDTYVSFGANNDVWGAVLTSANVNASNFGVVLQCRNSHIFESHTAYVDHMRITVYYTSVIGPFPTHFRV